MNPLENIGFYTLSDKRVKETGLFSSLKRCELILTDKCNFKCTYCRGINRRYKGTLELKDSIKILDFWLKEKLESIRFSGGEPCLYKDLPILCNLCKSCGVKNIAISTNGSMHKEKYEELLEAGVNDFSISLDACCASMGDKIAGNIAGSWNKVVENIEWLSKKTYVTVGCVVTEDNVNSFTETVKFAHELGVDDIRIISSAQYNLILEQAKIIPQNIIDCHPILKYRIENIKRGRNVRGMKESDYRHCALVLDDIVSVSNYHFPCIIYLREHGDSIGKLGNEMRNERYEWFKNHDCYNDPICRNNCLDVCIDYNNRYREFRCR